MLARPIDKKRMDNSHKNVIKNLDDKIHRISCKIKLITNNLNNIDNDDCAICCDDLKEPLLLDCSHIFCSKCIFGWIKMKIRNPRCPNCRTLIKSDKIIKVSNSIELEQKDKDENDNKIMGKNDTIIDIINKKPNGKYLIFSSSNRTFDILESDILNKCNYKYRTLKGNSGTMNIIIKDFSNGTINILMLNSTYNGAGINLPMATDIILYNKINLELEKQVIGRALRLGRKKDKKLTIHSLVYPHEK